MRLRKAEKELLENLTVWCNAIRKLGYWRNTGYCYHGIEDFVLSNGVWYRPRPLPRGLIRGRQKSCFNNAITLAIRHGFRYVEGHALAKIKVPIPIHHAWNLDLQDRVIDSTWEEPGRAYLGIVFNVERAIRANRHGGTVLDDPMMQNQLYQKPWTGERVA